MIQVGSLTTWPQPTSLQPLRAQADIPPEGEVEGDPESQAQGDVASRD